jgi:ribosomal protein L18E
MAKSVGKKESKMVNKIRRSVSNEFVPPSLSRWRVNFERRKEENALEMVVVVVVMVMESDDDDEDIALLAVTPFFS